MNNRTLLLLMLVTACSESYSQPASSIETLLKEGIFESPEMSFLQIKGAEEYVEKFGLGGEEIELVGTWDLDWYSRKISPEVNTVLLGLGSITLLPNRTFIASRGSAKLGAIAEVIGEWKVESEKLLIRLRAKTVKVKNSNEDISKRYRVDFLDSKSYFTVYQLTDSEYEQAYVNREPFHWGQIPLEYSDFYQIQQNDLPRYRILFDLPLAPITKGSRNGDILLNPIWTSEYVLKLITAWDRIN